MAIFNSLGSNYSKSFILKSFFGLGSASDSDEVSEQLKSQYGGEVTLTYKGRQALELTLRRSNLAAGSRVGINGFTCFVVYHAVKNAGLKPVFIDVAKDSLHFGLVELSKPQDLKAIIVQNTLGLPADMPAIATFAKKHKILIVEDLAHSMGSVYENGKEAGTVGDLVMLSFSQDKPCDVVAGGAVIDRRKKAQAQRLPGHVSGWQQHKNRTYPFWTGQIRTMYGLGVGRYLHYVLKKLNLLATPMSDDLIGLHSMTPLATHLLRERLGAQSEELVHRRTIAGIYEKELPNYIQYKFEGEPSFLRYPIKVEKPADLIEQLKNNEVYISDTWYDAPVAPKRYMAETSYESGQCPNAEAAVATILNLPTHRHVSETKARAICDIINEYLNGNK